MTVMCQATDQRNFGRHSLSPLRSTEHSILPYQSKASLATLPRDPRYRSQNSSAPLADDVGKEQAVALSATRVQLLWRRETSFYQCFSPALSGSGDTRAPPDLHRIFGD